MITQTSMCALRAMLYLAAEPNRKVKCSSMARSLHVPPGSLLRVLGDLAHAGLLRPQRGRNGGFCLAQDPSAITLLQVFSAAEQRNRAPGYRATLRSAKIPAVRELLDPPLHEMEGRLRHTSVLELLARTQSMHTQKPRPPEG